MVLKQMELVVKTDSGTYSNTFLTKPSLRRRTARETIMEYLLPLRILLFSMSTLHPCSKIWNAFSTFTLQFKKFLECRKTQGFTFLLKLCCVQKKWTHRPAEEQPEHTSFKQPTITSYPRVLTKQGLNSGGRRSHRVAQSQLVTVAVRVTAVTGKCQPWQANAYYSINS